jgi:hypothetical protein
VIWQIGRQCNEKPCPYKACLYEDFVATAKRNLNQQLEDTDQEDEENTESTGKGARSKKFKKDGKKKGN